MTLRIWKTSIQSAVSMDVCAEKAVTEQTLEPVTIAPLAMHPNVEIAMTGQWDISTGRVTLTDEDLAHAVVALECPAIRKPVLKIGHTDGRFTGDGEPSIGWVENMSLTDGGHTIVGDYVGMPGWVGTVLASAWPDRSMEAKWDFKCQIGHVHPFVITAVALLGVTPPGIGTLESLQDVANLYGVQAANADYFSVPMYVKGASTMPNPNPREVAAGVSVEDVRRSWYDMPNQMMWIKEMELDPLQLIVMDDMSGDHSRVPVTITGDNEFEFGDAVPVRVTYQDMPAGSGANMSASTQSIVYASKEESQPPPKPPVRVEDTLPPKVAIARVHEASVKAENHGKESGDMDPARIRELLGMSAEATDEEVYAAVATSRKSDGGDPVITPADKDTHSVAATSRVPEGMVMVDSAVIRSLQDGAQQGIQAMKEIQKSRRDTVISAAIQVGKFPTVRREHYETMWDGDPEGTEAHINSLAAGLVPIGAAAGFPGTETFQEDQQYFAMYPEDAPTKGGVR